VYERCSNVVTLFFAKKSLTVTDRCDAGIVEQEKSNVGIPFFGAFPCDHIPKATNQLMIENFPSFRNS